MLGDFILSFKPVDIPPDIDRIKAQLTTQEEEMIAGKAEEIIRYHGGADETTIMTGMIPYLHESSLLHRIAKYDIKTLLHSGNFVYVKADKRWYTADMVDDEGSVRISDLIPAEALVQELLFSYLRVHKCATIDELLEVIYRNLVNSHRPQLSTIGAVLSKYCLKKKMKGHKREVFIWKPMAMTPQDIKTTLEKQLTLHFPGSFPRDHNDIIRYIAQRCIASGFDVHVGETEQRKSPELKKLSAKLSGLELGLPPDAFSVIKEIDLLILKGATILAAIEVTTTISTLNKAINDRFRNLLVIAPNLKIPLVVIINESDRSRAQKELGTPANLKTGLAKGVKLVPVDQLASENILRDLMAPPR